MKITATIVITLFSLVGLFGIFFVLFSFWLGNLYFYKMGDQIKIIYKTISDGVSYTGAVKDSEPYCCPLPNWNFWICSVDRPFRYHNWVAGVFSFVVLLMCSSAVSCLTYTCVDGNDHHLLRIVFFALIGATDVFCLMLLFPAHSATSPNPTDPCFCMNSEDNKFARWCTCCSDCNSRTGYFHSIGSTTFFLLNPIFNGILSGLDLVTCDYQWYFYFGIAMNGAIVIAVFVYVNWFLAPKDPDQIFLPDFDENLLPTMNDEEYRFIATRNNVGKVASDPLISLNQVIDMQASHRDTILFEYIIGIAIIIANFVTVFAECVEVMEQET